MPWELVIDYREKALLASLPENSNQRTENLAIGDIQIRQDGDIKLLIERKTVPDLEASMCDGRYREQKFRILSSLSSNTKIAYLIEGDIRSATRVSTDALYGTIAGLWMRDGICVLRTTDVDETCTLIAKIFSRRELLNTPAKTEQTYGTCVHVKRRKDVPPEEVYLLMLRQIPGVSATIAVTIRTKFPSMRELIDFPVDSLECTVSELTYLTKAGPRRVGKTVAHRLHNFLNSITD